jgi:Glycosyltransferase family 87
MTANPKITILVAMALAGSMWFYVQRVMIGHQKAEAAAHNIPRGNLSDLYPRWLGARELLRHHVDPYRPEITREIQAGYYGRPLDAGLPDDPRDQQGFAYPVYVVFLLAPTVMLPFPVVQVGFRWFLAGLTVASVAMWLRVLRWKLSPLQVASACILTIGSFPVLQGIKLQQLSLLVSGMIAASAVLIVEGQFLVAGVILALATIKPQLVAILAGWLFVWACGDWKARGKLIWSAAGTMVVLGAASAYVLPGWIGKFLHAAAAYRQYNDGALSVLETLLSPFWGAILTAAILVGLAVLCWRNRRVASSSRGFVWITALVLGVTVLIAPKASPYNQVLLLPGVLLIIKECAALWGTNRLMRALFVGFAIALTWPWLAAAVLAARATVLPAAALQQEWALPLYTSLAVPVMVVVLLERGLAHLGRSDGGLASGESTALRALHS